MGEIGPRVPPLRQLIRTPPPLFIRRKPRKTTRSACPSVPVPKRVSHSVAPDVVHQPDPQNRRPKGPGRTPTYLVRRLSTYFFQIRPPSNLAASLPSCAPIRVRLGVLPHREAQRRASWLGALAQTGFSQWRGGVNTHTGQEIPCSDVGFPKGDSPEEFLANMLAFLESAAAKIANPPPWPDFSPDVLRDIASKLPRRLTSCPRVAQLID